MKSVSPLPTMQGTYHKRNPLLSRSKENISPSKAFIRKSTMPSSISMLENNRILKLKKVLPYLVIVYTLFSTSKTSGHQEPQSGTLDTGSSIGSVSWVFVGVGGFIFILILLSAIWLLKRSQSDKSDPKTYMEKIEYFGRNARLYILHIQGMSLTYGVRAILFNIYLLYIFRNGVTLFDREYNPVLFIGVLMAIGSLITGIMAPFNGIIVDKLGKKWSFILGDFFGAMSILAVIFIQTPGFVIMAQIFRSAVMSIHGIAEGPFIYEQSSEKERVHLFSVSSGLSTLASMSGQLAGGVVPLAIALLIYQTPIVNGSRSIFVLQVGLFISVILWLISLIPAFFLKEDPELKKRANEVSVSARLSFKNVTNWKTIGVFVLSSMFIGTGAGMFVSFFSVFFLLLYNASPAEISIIFALGSLFVAVGNFLSPILSEKYGKVNTIAFTRFGSIIFIALLPFAPILIFAGLFYLLRVTLMVGTYPAESALAMETVTDEERTTMEALRMGGSSIFSALGFIVGGYYMGIEDFVTPFIAAAVLYFIATLVFWLYFRNDNDVRLIEIVKNQSTSSTGYPVAGD
ncbi:MAG: MFS transporter [Candidatus Kariarchaeaceae archaeon]|jgi:MFS family permease